MNSLTATRDQRSASDADLVRALVPGREEALAELYRRHAGPIRSVARRLLWSADLADETTQDVFLSLWLAPERYDPERGSLRAYLQVQARRRAVDLARSETARRRREESPAGRAVLAIPEAAVEERVIDLTTARAVHRVVADLVPAEREAIELAYFGGHSYRQVAVLLGQPEGTVKNRIRAGLRRMRSGRWTVPGALRSPIRGREQPHP